MSFPLTLFSAIVSGSKSRIDPLFLLPDDWVDDFADNWVDTWVDGWVDDFADNWVDTWVDDFADDWVDGWVDGGLELRESGCLMKLRLELDLPIGFKLTVSLSNSLL
jgi:hypothetical protein